MSRWTGWSPRRGPSRCGGTRSCARESGQPIRTPSSISTKKPSGNGSELRPRDRHSAVHSHSGAARHHAEHDEQRSDVAAHEPADAACAAGSRRRRCRGGADSGRLKRADTLCHHYPAWRHWSGRTGIASLISRNPRLQRLSDNQPMFRSTRFIHPCLALVFGLCGMQEVAVTAEDQPALPAEIRETEPAPAPAPAPAAPAPEVRPSADQPVPPIAHQLITHEGQIINADEVQEPDLADLPLSNAARVRLDERATPSCRSAASTVMPPPAHSMAAASLWGRWLHHHQLPCGGPGRVLYPRAYRLEYVTRTAAPVACRSMPSTCATTWPRCAPKT